MNKILSVVLASVMLSLPLAAQCVFDVPKRVVTSSVPRRDVHKTTPRRVHRGPVSKKVIVCDKATPLDTVSIVTMIDTPLKVSMDTVELLSSFLTTEVTFEEFIEPAKNKKLWLWLIGAGTIAAIIPWNQHNDGRPLNIVPPLTPVPEPTSIALLTVGIGLIILKKRKISKHC